VTLVVVFAVWLVCVAIFAWLHRRMVERGEAQPVRWPLVIAVSALVWAVPLFYLWGR
jgi:hypothetical protein